VHPGDELRGHRHGQLAGSVRDVDRSLNIDVGLGLQGERPLVLFDLLSGKRAFDIARSGVVTLEQIRVVAVHDSDEVGQLGQAIPVPRRLSRVATPSAPRPRPLEPVLRSRDPIID